MSETVKITVVGTVDDDREIGALIEDRVLEALAVELEQLASGYGEMDGMSELHRRVSDATASAYRNSARRIQSVIREATDGR